MPRGWRDWNIGKRWLDFAPEMETLGGWLESGAEFFGLDPTDEEDAAALAIQEQRAKDIAQAEELAASPWKDPNVAAASLQLGRQREMMESGFRDRRLSASEGARMSGEAQTKMGIEGNQKLALLQMQIRDLKRKEIAALKKEDYEFARKLREDGQVVAKLIMDLTAMYMGTKVPNVPGLPGSTGTTQPYTGSDYSSGSPNSYNMSLAAEIPQPTSSQNISAWEAHEKRIRNQQ